MKIIDKIKQDPKLRIISWIVGIVLLWMISGIFKSSKKIESTNINTAVLTRSIESIAQDKTKYIKFSATAYANDGVDLVTQISGRVVKKFVSDGAKLKAGDKIIQIENSALSGRVEQMKDAVQSAKLRYESAVELQKKQFGSKLAVEDAKTSLNASEADLALAQVALRNSFILAPFDGIADSINVQEGDVLANVGAGHSLVGRFINLNLIETKSYISQKERNNIKDSTEALIINEKNQTIDAKVSLVANSADAKSGTFLIKTVGENNIGISDGESVKIKLKVGVFKSHNLPISALILDGDGDLAVKTINDVNNSTTYKVAIIDEDEKGVWVSGLPEKCKVILSGQSYTN
jgi:multidrug efflux system membrane fusion protein